MWLSLPALPLPCDSVASLLFLHLLLYFQNVLELSVVGKYAANIALPREVMEEGIRATFSPKTHVLRVVLPVL